VGYTRLTRLRLLAARILREFARSPGLDVLGAFALKFLRKMGPFIGGSILAVASEEDLVFREKVESPLTLLKLKFTCVQPTGRRICAKDLGILSMGRILSSVGELFAFLVRQLVRQA
jgi:hypothetical protein